MTTEQKTEFEFETVDVALTVKLPKPWLPILNGLAEITDLPIEAILADELYGVLESFFSGDFFNAWMEYAAEQHGLDKARIEQLEEMIKQVRP